MTFERDMSTHAATLLCMLRHYCFSTLYSHQTNKCHQRAIMILCLLRPTAALARLPSLKGQENKKPSIKPSGGVLAFLHRLRPGRATGVNRVANRAPSKSWPSIDSGRNAWQALSETSGSEDAKVRSVAGMPLSDGLIICSSLLL